jgi:hypothetical protein
MQQEQLPRTNLQPGIRRNFVAPAGGVDMTSELICTIIRDRRTIATGCE